MIPFVPKQKELGNLYHQPVVVAYPSGFTHAAASAGAFTLNGPVASTMKDAQINGSQIVLREYMDYEAAAKAAKGRNAFLDATSLMFENMQKSHRKRLEIELLYGQAGVGVVSAKSATTSPTVITFTDATWAPGIWAGSEGMKFDCWSAVSAGTNRNTNAALVVSAVDIDNKQVTFTGNNTDINAITAGDHFFFFGGKDSSGASQEMAGIHAILSNTGTLFNISASSYSLWKSTQYSAGSAALTFNKVKAAVAAAVGRGLDEDMVLLVNPVTWDNLLSDLAALRRFVEKQGKGTSYEIGSENIVFYSQAGKIEIVPSIYVKQGSAYGLVPSSWKRIGATDVTFETPGYGGQIFTQLSGAAGFDVRSYCHEAVLCEMPARQILLSNIVNV